MLYPVELWGPLKKVPAHFSEGKALERTLLISLNMARFNTSQVSEYPFHVTGRRHNKAAFDIELDEVWKIMCELLYLTHQFFGLKIHLFVLMPNHFHLVCTTESEPLGLSMGYFMRESSKTMNRISGKVVRFHLKAPPNFIKVYHRSGSDVMFT